MYFQGYNMRKITPEGIKDKLKAYESYYAEHHRQQKEVDEYYELTFDAEIPTKLGYQQITPPTAREWVDIGVRHFTLDNPKAKVPPRGTGDAARKKDANLESFWNFWLEQMILQIKESAKKSLLRGEVFIKVGMDDTYYGVDVSKLSEEEKEEIENKRLVHFPLFVTVPDPINVYCSPAHNGFVPVDVIEFYEMTVSEAQNLCDLNEWLWRTEKKSTDTVKWMSYFDRDWRCFFLGDEPVIPVQPNLFHFCPYVHIPSGYGHSSYQGKPETLYRSILYPQKGVLKMETRQLSQVDAESARYAWPRPKIIGEEEDVKQIYPDPKTDLFSPDAIIRETDRVKVEILSGEPLPPNLFQLLALARAYAQTPSILGGVRPAGVYSAQGMEDLMSTAKPIYKDVIKNLEDGLAVLLGMGAKIVDTVYRHPIDLNGERINPSDIDGHYNCKVQLLAEPPEATQMRKNLGDNEQKAGVISHLYNLIKHHDMGEAEARKEIARIIAEQAMREPGMREFVVRDAMKLLGMEEAEEELEATRRAAGPLPPRRQPGVLPTAYEGTPKRGRMTPELEGAPTPQETRITEGTPMER
jgi:hypothetical protein